MLAPLIGVTTRNTFSDLYKIPLISTPKSYCDALINAGALPVLIPLNLPFETLQALMERLDGVVFTGGGDIETAKFNGIDHIEVYDVDPQRDEIELQLVHDVVESEKPFLGICRGLQVLNVAYGGTLFTHIADQVENPVLHTCFPDYPWDHRAHPVQISEGSRLSEIIGKPILEVNSLHHQGVKELASNLKPVANAPDGLVEAVELTSYDFGLAVQWHPEWLPQDPDMQSIFSEFVRASSNAKQ